MAKQLRYLEIAQTLKSKIKQGFFPQGQSLPSQKELSSIFNTSVMTIRGALAVLEEEGILTIVHGVGTFVGAPGIHTDSISLQGFQNEMDQQKMCIVNRILDVEHDIENANIRRLFKDDNAVFSCLTRLRTIEEVPVILQRSYVHQKFRDVLVEYAAEKSLYQFFSRKTGIMVTQGREIMMPVVLKDDELKQLSLSGPCTAFLSKRISISLDDEVVLYDEAYLPGPYVIMASRKHGKNNMFKYIINKSGTLDSSESFNDPELWEDLI